MDNLLPGNLDLTLKCLKKEKLFCLSMNLAHGDPVPTGLREKGKLQVAQQKPHRCI